ncbi:hypothetical protein ACLSU7_02220 [Bdellovibrio sp. HCB185ZH]|uniref:hypothetical protein n=1 Tax=Bdellovibrio sp. HCB185ZH TaxID=3394235 RepID=UPI0039A66109
MKTLRFIKYILGVGIAALLVANNAHAKTFCSMTLNSNDEINTFALALTKQGFDFVELVPPNKDPRWFQNACASGIKCDVLLISGHFGGLFFGEGTSQTIDIAQMEKASCDNSCPGILKNPKEVFLMGCNTLASQARDHRTIDQYLNVLLNDGIPLDFAEQVVASRYSQQGFSLEKRFASIFPETPKLYGFYSTGPLGKYAAPILNRYLKSVGNYNTHLDTISNAPNTAILNAFKGQAFRETIPQKAVPPEARGLYCALRSNDKSVQSAALTQIAQENKVTTYFDSLASQLSYGDSIAGQIDQATKQIISKSLSKIKANNSQLVTIQHDVMQVASSLGLMDPITRDIQVRMLLDQAYGQSMNYAKVRQICGIIRDEPGFQNMTFTRLQELSKRSPYFMLTLSCYSEINNDIRDFLFSKIASPDKEHERTIALYVMKPFWNEGDMDFLSMVLKTADPVLRTRLFISARKVLGQYRYSLLNAPGLPACVFNAEFRMDYSLGKEWTCLSENQANLSPDVCDYFAGRNPDPENADDMRWYCWSNNKQRFLNSRPECYLLAETFKIRGNQMKNIWNCSNRDIYGY